jgi:hypothetical protein
MKHETYNPNVHNKCTNHIPAVPLAIAGAIILGYDAVGENTVSQWVRDRVHDPRTRVMTLGLMALSAYHLTRPDKYPYQNVDPVTRIGGLIRDIL